VRPVLDALRPASIVEIGAEYGDVTARLLDWADARPATVHVIDPAPLFDVKATAAAHPDSFKFHHTRSLRVLPRIPAADLVLIDGDHNWHTVTSELRQLERRAARDRRLPPLTLLHDVEWPYARRDLYYDPDAIPARRRHEYVRAGIVPGDAGVRNPGLNPALNNALREGGEANGVLTAVEDFLEESGVRWTFLTVPGLFGLGILAPKQLLSRRRKLRDAVQSTQTPDFLRRQCLEIERARIAAVIRANELERRDGGLA
jgi:hypothetical protein